MTFETAHHKVNLTGGEISTILYHLDCAFNNISEDIHPPEIQRIYAKLQGVADNWEGTFEEENDNEERIIDYRGNSYAENVDSLVARMGSGWH